MTCVGKPDDGGRLTVRSGVPTVRVAGEVVAHLTDDGVAGGGGSVAGAMSDWVSASIEGARLGGMMKCKVSSLLALSMNIPVTIEEENLTL